MNEHTHESRDAFASPFTRISRAAVGSESAEFAPDSARPYGRHRLPRRNCLRGINFLPFRAIAAAATAAARAAAAFAAGTNHAGRSTRIGTGRLPRFARTVISATAVVAAVSLAATTASAATTAHSGHTVVVGGANQVRIGTLVPARTIQLDQSLIRRERTVLGRMSTAQVEQLLLKTLKPEERNPSLVRADGLGYSRTGDTIWLSKTEVIIWAAASVAAIIGVLIVLGVPGATADVMVGSIVGTLVGAVFLARCVWITYDNPRSWGNYSC